MNERRKIKKRNMVEKIIPEQFVSTRDSFAILKDDRASHLGVSPTPVNVISKINELELEILEIKNKLSSIKTVL
jgi:hypothetical protein